MSVEEFVLTAADILLEQVCHFCNSCFYFHSIHGQTHSNRFIGHCFDFRYQIWDDRSFQFPCCTTLPETSKVGVQGYSCFLVCVGSEAILLSLEVWEVSKQWRWQKENFMRLSCVTSLFTYSVDWRTPNLTNQQMIKAVLIIITRPTPAGISFRTGKKYSAPL